jgi:hypothetical protein
MSRQSPRRQPAHTRCRTCLLIRRLPHTNHYVLTADGVRIAVFYTKICNRLLVPLTAADQPQAPPELRAACAPSTSTLTATSPAPASAPPRELDTNVQKLATKDR